MGWRHDEKKARKLADSDPAAALELLEGALPHARESSLSGPDHLRDLLSLTGDVAESAGRADVAERARTELRSLCETVIAEQERTVAEGGGPFKVSGALQAKARFLDALGRETEANRARLEAADVALAAIGDAGAKARVAATPVLVAAQGAMGLETARAFQHGYESNFRAIGELMRDPLLADGRAVALAYCRKCGGVVEANWKKGKCERKHRVDEVRVVLAEDAAATRAELEGRSGGSV